MDEKTYHDFQKAKAELKTVEKQMEKGFRDTTQDIIELNTKVSGIIQFVVMLLFWPVWILFSPLLLLGALFD